MLRLGLFLCASLSFFGESPLVNLLHLLETKKNKVRFILEKQKLVCSVTKRTFCYTMFNSSLKCAYLNVGYSPLVILLHLGTKKN